MKRNIIVAIAVFLVGAATLQALPYDKAATVQVMRDNVARIGAIKAAAAASDWNKAAQLFFDFANAAQAEMAMDPPKGFKEDWTATWQGFIDQAYRGVGACAEKDPAKVLKALDDLVVINKHGHGTFRF